MFKDKYGNLSSKRVSGFIVILAATVFTFLNKGDPEIIKVMFMTGFAAMAAGVLEKK